MIKNQAQPNNNSKTNNNNNNNNQYLYTESAALLGQDIAFVKPGLQSVDLGATILYLGTSDLGDFGVSKEEQGLLNEE